jgi:hypothetical protein
VAEGACDGGGEASTGSGGGARLQRLGDVPWNLTALRQRAARPGALEDCRAGRRASFVLVDTRRNLAKILSDANPRLLVVFYRAGAPRRGVDSSGVGHGPIQAFSKLLGGLLVALPFGGAPGGCAGVAVIYIYMYKTFARRFAPCFVDALRGPKKEFCRKRGRLRRRSRVRP